MATNIEQFQDFNSEVEFEQALCDHLLRHGWNEVLMYPTEQELLDNWARIILDNNRGVNQLGNYPLTATEMQQIIDKVDMCDSPYLVNNLINNQEICIKRDNQDDVNNFGKEVYLKIFDAHEICSGQSRYQIARQPKFRAAHPLAGTRRGDLMLLINGMPVIHIELKKSGIDVSQATFQLKRYTHEGVFAHGIFSMVQIFVAMTPRKTLYFANPGSEDRFAEQYYFHWADSNNNEIHDWRRVATDLISIPMAHMLVGFYTIADDKDKSLKVLRSYQYYAVNAISDAVHKNTWDEHQHRGGYIWHTTGSGKTMTSFKSAQLIANSGDADKVVFLLDRIELGVQSLDEYRGFAGDPDSVQDTQDTTILCAKLKSPDKDDTLIVTSIQKMHNIAKNPDRFAEDLKVICKKRLVFIIDECHRNVFGEMLMRIKNTFTKALLFGFTGTPVFPENAHNEIVTADIFGNELHKYTIGHAIPDGNVLGFDPYMVETTEESDLRDRAARYFLGGIESVDEIEGDEDKLATYNRFMTELPMQAEYLEDGKVKHGIEYYLPNDFYRQDIHHQKVAADIVNSFQVLSQNGKFHAMLATKNIPEAIDYYHIFKEKYPSLNVIAIFDENIDNSDAGIVREDAILEMLDDYNQRYGTSFQLSTYHKYKKDAGKRLAHKKPYIGIENDHSQQIDLLIVVTQMLTGYDSKWINTLYVDKVMRYVDIIQSFSRTNRLFGPDKPHGTIKYYTMPFTMKQNIDDALRVYVDRPDAVFVDHLEVNLTRINSLFFHIKSIFESFGIMNFEKLPESRESRNMFAKDFANMTHTIKSAKLQGFMWEKSHYEFQHEDTYTTVDMLLDEATYNVLLARYRELFTAGPGGGGDDTEFDYPIDAYIAETGTGTIDAEYINSKFVLYVRNLYMSGPEGDVTKAALAELCKTFASMSQKDQRTALLIIHDIQMGALRLELGKTIFDYITEYQLREIHKLVLTLGEATGINVSQLDNIINSDVNEQNLNQYNRFDQLRLSVNNVKAQNFIQKVTGESVEAQYVSILFADLLRLFILDADMRVTIINAYLNDDVTFDINQPTAQPEPEPAPVATPVAPAPVVTDPNVVRAKLANVSSTLLSGVSRYMRPATEIVKSVDYVLETTSINTLDAVGIYVNDAFNKLYGRQPNFVDKMTSFHQLVTQFEAYLKKLYYLIHGTEVQPAPGNTDVTWKDVIKSFTCLWGLKHNPQPVYQQLYQCLELVKGLRNGQSHMSPTASDQEVDNAISAVLTMYLFATGSSITDLEMAGHNIG
ncbi:MAG: HsdR family type I site-specific deoxyribonuclease [Bacteroidales bacterium]|nr:HsdR family type I site-specific deoxyribonuclease [Bacteroidales bacterium]